MLGRHRIEIKWFEIDHRKKIVRNLKNWKWKTMFFRYLKARIRVKIKRKWLRNLRFLNNEKTLLDRDE